MSWAAESWRSREKAWYAATKKRVMFSGIREVVSMYHFHVVELAAGKMRIWRNNMVFIRACAFFVILWM
jgi:hypothetical protein